MSNEMNNQLKKAIELSKKTGDRLMVYDMSNPDDTYIVMGIDDYERQVIGEKSDKKSDLTDTELTDKINRDIAAWKDEQSIEKNENIDDNEEQNDELIYDYKQNHSDGKVSENGKKKYWGIPKSRRGNIKI